MHFFNLIPLIDFAAFIWFFTAYFGYQAFSVWLSQRRPSLLSETNKLRQEWMARANERDLRTVDAAIMANLSNTATFFASTTIIVIGALFALLSRTELVQQVVLDIPFAAHSSEFVWQIKVVTLIGIFVYAFFRFTWSIRQYNFAAIMIGSAMLETFYEKHPEDFERDSKRSGIIVGLAAQSFNDGLRAYYFAIAAISWFLHPILLMISSSIVVWILYQREFESLSLKALLLHRPTK